jgi:hypothetical protein
VGGSALALWLRSNAPHEQHVRIVLGAAAPDVTAVSLSYVGADGEVAREAQLIYPPGKAPRVVAHEPQLPDGDYQLRIDVEAAQGGRRAIQRQVTLGGGSTQVDVSSAVSRDE